MAHTPKSLEQTHDDLGSNPIRDSEVSPYLVVLHGTDVGKRFRISSETVSIGRGDEADLVLNDTRISKVHCFLQASGTTKQMSVRDNDSHNGTFVDGQRIESVELTRDSMIRLGQTVFRIDFKAEEEIKLEIDLFRSATMDHLTQIPNRRLFETEAVSPLSFSRRHHHPLCLAMLDVDFFKKVNDTYGHQAGDQVLIDLASVLNTSKRGEDLVCRYGGEEFLLLLCGTPLKSAEAFCERVRKHIEGKHVQFGKTKIRVTVSIGLSAFREQDTLVDLIQRADQALYRAKEGGRNRVEIESES